MEKTEKEIKEGEEDDEEKGEEKGRQGVEGKLAGWVRR